MDIFRGWVGILPVLVSFVGMAALSWKKCGDILIDFGFQLYMPWQINMGRVLYRDGNSYFGPFSQYFNAILFRLFGVSLETLVFSHLVFLGLVTILLYRLFLCVADQVTAGLVCMVFLVVFAFAQLSMFGNYNYLSPYCYEVVHGLYASILAIALLRSWWLKEKSSFAGLAGFATGIVAMTKPELFLSVAVMAGVALGAAILARKDRSFLIRSVLRFLLCGLILPVGFVILFSTVAGMRDGIGMAFRGLSAPFSSEIVHARFYQWCLGLDNPYGNLFLMAKHFLVVVLYLFLGFLCCRWGAGVGMARRVASILVLSVLAVAAFAYDWTDCGRSLPPVSAIICLHLFREWRGADGGGRDRLVFPLLWSVFGLVLLAKMGIYSRIWQYGFVLAMPATLGSVYYFSWFLPNSLRRYGVDATLFRVFACCVILAGLFDIGRASRGYYDLKNCWIGQGGDAMLTYGQEISPRAAVLDAAVRWIGQNVPPGATIASLPEGAMLNYLTRHPNPTRYHSAAMELVSGRKSWEAGMIGEFAETKPEYIVLVHGESAEFGVPYFGRSPEYGMAMMNWIDRNYTAACLVGREPLQDGNFGIKIFRRSADRGQYR